MKYDRNELIAHSGASNEISHKSRYIQKYSVTTKWCSSDICRDIYKASPSKNYIENICKKYRSNSSLKSSNMIVADLTHEEIPGSDIGIFISKPAKEINPYTLIQDVTAVATHDNGDCEITIDHFYGSTISYVIDNYEDSEIQLVLTNQGLIMSMIGDSDLVKYLLRNNNGKIQIIFYYLQGEISVEDSSVDPYMKIPIYSNNFEKLSQFFNSYFRFENLEIAKYFIKKYPNSYIYDFSNADGGSIIDLSCVEHFSDSGTKVLKNNKILTSDRELL